MSTYTGPAADRGSQYDAYFYESAAKWNVDPSVLKSMAFSESSFYPNVTSKAGAMGIMQLMPGTAKTLGVSNAYDPAQCIDGGAHYLRMMLDRYGEDYTKALMAYNAGPGNVDNGKAYNWGCDKYASKILGRVDGALGADYAQQAVVQPASYDQAYVDPAWQQYQQQQQQQVLTAEQYNAQYLGQQVAAGAAAGAANVLGNAWAQCSAAMPNTVQASWNTPVPCTLYSNQVQATVASNGWPLAASPFQDLSNGAAAMYDVAQVPVAEAPALPTFTSAGPVALGWSLPSHPQGTTALTASQSGVGTPKYNESDFSFLPSTLGNPVSLGWDLSK